MPIWQLRTSTSRRRCCRKPSGKESPDKTHCARLLIVASLPHDHCTQSKTLYHTCIYAKQEIMQNVKAHSTARCNLSAQLQDEWESDGIPEGAPNSPRTSETGHDMMQIWVENISFHSTTIILTSDLDRFGIVPSEVLIG